MKQNSESSSSAQASKAETPQGRESLNTQNRITLLIRDPVRSEALMDFANMVNAMYGATSLHSHLIGDCVLAKLNMLRKGKRVRKTTVALKG